MRLGSQRASLSLLQLLLSQIVLLASVQHASAAVTNSDLNKIKCAVFQAIDVFPGLGPQPLLAKIVRLAFHDCIGGCDGAVNMSDHGNAGLEAPMQQLEILYQRFSNKMSRADFWATAAAFAVFKGTLNAGPQNLQLPPLRFLFGRVDGSGIHIIPPNPHGGMGQVINFFNQTFKLTAVDSIALMGAHTLGGAMPQNSGFEGPWKMDSHTFTNAYYQSLLRADGWQLVKNSGGNLQWKQANTNSITMMLNVDMALARDIGSPSLIDGKGTTCMLSNSCNVQKWPVEGVPGVRTAFELIALYAKDNALWLNHFATAFNKMVAFTAPRAPPLWEVAYTRDTKCCCSVPCSDGNDGGNGGDDGRRSGTRKAGDNVDKSKTPTTPVPTTTPVPQTPAPCAPQYGFPPGSYFSLGANPHRRELVSGVAMGISMTSGAGAVGISSALAILARILQLKRRREAAAQEKTPCIVGEPSEVDAATAGTDEQA